jgi:glutamate racemase
MRKTGPIGIFDSGIGGTSIWKEIHALLPWEDTLYLADSKYAPYGTRPISEIVALSRKNTEFLIQAGCKIIVVACNTATTNAIKVLRENYDIPIIGIEPAIKPAALQTLNKTIGILATRGTLSSDLFNKTSEAFTKDINVIEVVGEGLVALIEQGSIDSEEIIASLTTYMQPMINAHIDYLVLGCTHYPYLIPILKKLLPENVTIIDSGAAVARQTKAIMSTHHLLEKKPRTPVLRFYSNAEITPLKFIMQDYLDVIEISQKDF